MRVVRLRVAVLRCRLSVRLAVLVLRHLPDLPTLDCFAAFVRRLHHRQLGVAHRLLRGLHLLRPFVRELPGPEVHAGDASADQVADVLIAPDLVREADVPTRAQRRPHDDAVIRPRRVVHFEREH